MLELNTAGKLDTNALITHGMSYILSFYYCRVADGGPDFNFSEIEKAYDVFGRAAETKALKVNIEFD